MASLAFFNPLRTPLFFASITASSALLFTPLLHHHRRPILCDSTPSPVSPKDWSFSQYQNDARTPIVNKGGGLNARAVRQMSAGSIIGTPLPHNKQSPCRAGPRRADRVCRPHRRPRHIALLQTARPPPRPRDRRRPDGGEVRHPPRAVQVAAAVREQCGSAERGAG